MSLDLKSCPFCGGRPTKILSRKDNFNLTDRIVIETGGSYWVKCEHCQTSTWVAGSVREAEETWNKRVPDAATA